MVLKKYLLWNRERRKVILLTYSASIFNHNKRKETETIFIRAKFSRAEDEDNLARLNVSQQPEKGGD